MGIYGRIFPLPLFPRIISLPLSGLKQFLKGIFLKKVKYQPLMISPLIDV
jgi:hypothetical protein